MKKKILIGLGIVVLAVVGFMAYSVITTRNLSPKDKVAYSKDGLDIAVDYGRPYKKGRVIFGPKEAGALQPFGEYWRAGANEATEINLSKDVTFGGQPVKAGQYVMYAIPGEKSWTIALNSETGRWGYWEAKKDLDVLRVEVPVQQSPDLTEQFTIGFREAENNAVQLQLKWDQTLVEVPIAPASI